MSQIEPALLADLLRQAMNEGKSPFLTVISNSMSPLIRRGDQIRLGPTTAESLNPGDIIVFLGPANLITHRYWGCYAENSETCLVTKGDRPQHFDQPFTQGNLVGQVIGRRRKQQLLNLSAGAGKWLNNHLAALAKLEIRLFSKPPALAMPAQVQLPPTSGWLADSPNGIIIRLIRRFLYSWAIILSAIIARFTSTFNKDIED
jgi:signal peptidase I